MTTRGARIGDITNPAREGRQRQSAVGGNRSDLRVILDGAHGEAEREREELID